MMDRIRRKRDNGAATDDHGASSYVEMAGGRRPNGETSKQNYDATNLTMKYENYEPDDDEVYIVKQNHGYLSVLFSIVQTAILGLMMWQCGVAPLNINPMVGPYPDALSEWGGKNAVLILDDDQWWRLLTPLLLHAGVIHLLCNVAVQLETGVFFEREWGSASYLFIYLMSGVASSVLSVIKMPNAVSVGSSGAVMGLMGGKMAEVLLRVCERRDSAQHQLGHQVRKEQCCVVSCSVVLVMAFSFIPYVDWAAHLGGLLGGFVCGVLVFAFSMETWVWKIVWICVGTALMLITYVTLLLYMYHGNIDYAEELRDVCGYYKQVFDDYECKCMLDEYRNGN